MGGPSAEVPKQAAENVAWMPFGIQLPPSLSFSLLQSRKSLLRSGSWWREIVPPMARHALGAAGQLLTTFALHLLFRKSWLFPPPLLERSLQMLAKSSTFQCFPEGDPFGKFLPLFCFQNPFYPILMACQILPSGSLGLHTFSLAHGYPPSFEFSKFPFFPIMGGWEGQAHRMP